MLRRSVLTKAALLLTAVVTLFSMNVAYAASSTKTGTSGDAFKISPVRQDVVVKPGTSLTVDVWITNLSNDPQNLQVVLNDFIASGDETGTPQLLLNGKAAPTHGLKQFITAIPNVMLAAQQQKDVKVTITIPKNAAGGGYFGAVRFVPAGNNTTTGSVSLTGSVGSLLLVTVPGNITEHLSVAKFGAASQKTNNLGSFFTSGKDLEALVSFSNTGNIQLEPFGKIELKKASSVLGVYEINNTTPRGNVLPDSMRRFTSNLTGVGSLGKYTLVGNFGYGSKGQLLTTTSTFYIVPVSAIAIGFVVLLFIIFCIFVLPKMIRAYNQRIVKKASGK